MDNKKFQEKVSRFINSIYALYFMTGIFYASTLMHNAPVPNDFWEGTANLFYSGMLAVFWFPLVIIKFLF